MNRIKKKRFTIDEFKLFIILFVTANFHLLINLMGVGYFGILFAVYFLVFSIAFFRPRFYPNNYGWQAYFLYLLWLPVLFSLSLFYTSVGNVGIAFPRLLIAPFLTIGAYVLLNDIKEVKKIVILFLIFCCIASLSIVYQLIFGHISWFATEATRGGLGRFTSIFGSLTIIGVANGVGLIVALLIDIKKWIKILIVFCIVLGMLLCLQKAAFANILFSVVIYVLVKGNFKVLLKIAILSAFLLGTIYLLGTYKILPPIIISYIDASFLNALNISIFGSKNVRLDSYIISESSLLQRLIEQPLEVINAIGIGSIIFGAGVIGGGGSMGIPGAEAHNALGDILFIGGIPLMIIFILMIVGVFLGLKKRMRFTSEKPDPQAEMAGVLLGALIMFIVNLPFASGVIFQPNISCMFWLALGIVFKQSIWNQNREVILAPVLV